MAKILVALVLQLLYVGVVFGVTLDDLFIVQTGSDYLASCDDRLATLNSWITESTNVVKVAQDVMGFYNENSERGFRVRQAMLTWFKINNEITKTQGIHARNIIAQWIFHRNSGHRPRVFVLQCDSDWLIEQEATEQAYDTQNHPIVDGNGDPVAINAVPSYKSQLAGADVPWWSGTFTKPPVYGYVFAPTDGNGGNYCQKDDHAGLTSTISGHNSADPGVPAIYEIMILCPSAFDNSQPADLAAGVALILSGALTGAQTGEGATPASTTIKQALPKSFTLLHEAMHVIFGSDTTSRNAVGMLTGADERYDLGQVIDLAKMNAAHARINPESFMFFFAQLNYMFGRAATNGVTTNIDFNNPNAAKLCVNGCGDTALVVT